MLEQKALSPTIYTSQNAKRLKEIPILEDGQIYIYVLLNSPQGNIKIGKTTNIIQRISSLSGSNGAGNKIKKIYLSPSTYIEGIEKTAHRHYDYARIKGTEWFDGKKVNYDDVVSYVDSLFTQKGYETCNELRRKIYIEKHKEEKD